MSRRLIAALLVTSLVTPPLLASGAPAESHSRGALPTAQRLDEIEAMFAQAEAAQSYETEAGVMISMPAMEVVVARIGPDGKVILGCVDSAAAMRRFLDAPAERLPEKRAAER